MQGERPFNVLMVFFGGWEAAGGWSCFFSCGFFFLQLKLSLFPLCLFLLRAAIGVA